MKSFLILFFSMLFVMACTDDDKLVSKSVVQAHRTSDMPLDRWILDSITTPYGIAVDYRWNKYTAPLNGYVYPPDTTAIRPLLRTLRTLWLALYTNPKTGGTDFLKDKRPLKIYLFGGPNLDSNGVERINNPSASTLELYVFNVNHFRPNDPVALYILLRSVHHQFAKRIGEVFPYDRDAFRRIAPKHYTDGSTEFMRTQLPYLTTPDALYRPTQYAHHDGLYTYHSFLSADDEFAEIISLHFLHTPTEFDAILDTARRPPHQDPDPEVYARDKAYHEARAAEMERKREFVLNYYRKTVGIDLHTLQLLSLKRIKAFIAAHSTP